ncbi:MAG: BatA domain-containing protein [Prosthecobacter sp.]|uniref:BatA domain-containing protein n=1 Tax=Prosthecobacter sp. TaxID=1965333 RepID=UPI0026154B9F|nr:BatA domain-containing protein [Prosthecobacter sp.]MCF7789739.1 BatA domain-containing protein [Prosthecobacter sp.]
MSFLHGILLAGAAAFLIPLIIHLLNKRKVITVRWGAMHLLHEVIRQRKRKMKVEQLLLLLIRISIPIVLALCLARPVLTALRSLGLGSSSLIVMLDDSLSMRAPAAQTTLPGGTVIEQARQDMQTMLTDLPDGSSAQVILSGGTPRKLLDQSTTDLDLVPKQLSEVPSMSGPLAANDAFQAATSALKDAPNAAREVVIVSDFQEADWKAIADGAALPALENLNKQEPKPQITFFRVGSDLAENISIASADISALVAAESQPIGLRVRIKNHGKRPWQDIPVHLEADGARLRTARVSLAPEGEAVLSFTHAFDKVGDHSLSVRLEGDSFADDNAFHSIVQVRNQLNVLLIDGSPGKEPLSGATDFLEIALTPHTVAAATLKDLIRTKKIDLRKMRDDDLREQEVVIMADVQRLQGRSMGDLEKFVKEGGGLLVFAGPDCDVDWYNRDFFRKGEGLYPAAIKGQARADSDSLPARILMQRFTHPAALYFNDARAGRLQDAEFRHWFEFTPQGDQTQRIFNLDRNVPLMIEKKYGRGRVIAAATTANPAWSNLPLQPFFVPLMQRLTTYLATEGSAPAWQLVGSAIRLPLEKAELGSEFTLRDPTGQTQTLKSAKEGDAVFVQSPPITQPGIFQLQKVGTEKTTLLAFNIDGTESNLKALAAADIQKIAQRYDAAYADTLPAYQALDRTRRHGSELWQPLLILLLMLLFGEVLLQQHIAKG